MNLKIDPTLAIFNSNIAATTPSLQGGRDQHGQNQVASPLRSLGREEFASSLRPNLASASAAVQSLGVAAPVSHQSASQRESGESETGRFRRAGIEVYQGSKP
jgi:hypothetical protein